MSASGRFLQMRSRVRCLQSLAVRPCRLVESHWDQGAHPATWQRYHWFLLTEQVRGRAPPEHQEPFPLFLGGQAQVRDGDESRAEAKRFEVVDFVLRQGADDSFAFLHSRQRFI